MGVCPWCRYPTEGMTGEFCPECGNHLLSGLGPPDPGNRKRGRVGMVLALVLILMVAVVQQTGGSGLAKGGGPGGTGGTGGAGGTGGEVLPPDAQFEIMAKIFTRFQKVTGDKGLADQAVETLEQMASGEADRVRAAVLAGELKGVDAGRERLARVEKLLPEDSVLRGDIETVRGVYDGSAVEPGAVAGLKKRHGYFGELAASHGLPDTAPERARLIGGGMGLLILTVLVGAAVFLSFVAGVVVLVMGLVWVSSGKVRPAFVPPAPGGSLAIEVVALFAGGFLLLKGVLAVAEGVLAPGQVMWLALVAQWGLLAVFLWPRFVGARGGMRLLGWHRGEGVLKEVGCGVLGYLACVPLFLFGAAVSMVLTVIEAAVRQWMTGVKPPPPQNPLMEIVSGKMGPLMIVMVYLLASLWAPVVEETVFRGGMYRHLRSTWNVVVAAVFTALCFGVMHAYPILMMGPVIALGFGFALLREWRGSLIASMTAHGVHNAVVLGLLLFAMRLLG